MSSRGKKKTTMAKLTRESRLRERRVEKQARKEARRIAGPMVDEAPLDPEAEIDDDQPVAAPTAAAPTEV
jgi:hypothetical protein